LISIKEPELITPITAALLLICIIGALVLSPTALFYLAIVAVLSLAIGFFALRNRMLFKLALRNIVRRKGLSAIVVGGLMIGTVIISSSLVVGDTMDEMIVSVHYDIYHEVDEVIYYRDMDMSYGRINISRFDDLRSRILHVENVDSVVGEIEEEVAVMDVTSGQTEGSMMLIGYDPLVDGFGTFRRGGEEVGMDIGPEELYLDRDSADSLDASVGDTLIIPTRSGTHRFTVKEVIDREGRAAWGMGNAVFMPLASARRILTMNGSVNIIKVSNHGGARGGERYCDQVVGEIDAVLEEMPLSGLEVRENKADEIETAREDIKEFSQMFLVFGSFSILAGVVLIINIFVMLGEERKGEMGISRAVGMRRKHLRESFIYEGTIYALLSSFMGAAVGIGVAYIVLYILELIFGNALAGSGVLEHFTFTPVSMAVAFCFGVLLTVLTVSISAMRISRLNIIRAIRNIPEPRLHKRSRVTFWMGSLLLVGGLTYFVISYWSFPDWGLSRIQEVSVHLGISLSMIGGGLVLRRFTSGRFAASLSSLLLIAYWMVPSDILLPAIVPGDLEVFFLSGVVLVSSAIFLFLFNSNDILGLLTRLWGLTGRSTAPVKTASSYPMKNKFRTGMTIYMFALVIFTITVMSMIIGVFSYNIEKITEEQMGDIDLIGFASPNTPISDIWIELEENSSVGDGSFKEIYTLKYGMVSVNTSTAEGPYSREDLVDWQLIGIPDDFSNCGWSFLDRMDGFETDGEVWDAVAADPDLVVLDGSFWDGESMGFESPLTELGLRAGDTIRLRTADGTEVNRTVAGILDQFIMSGIFVKEGTLPGTDESSPPLYIFKLKDGQNEKEVARDMERDLGIEMFVLKEQVREYTRIMEQFFDLFMAYMSLGLIVGIAGLGIITLRAVHERRQEIGMMRAIGFIRKGVAGSFLMEASFISMVGILIGSILGIGIGYRLWYDEFRVIDFDFVVPWAKIGLIALVALVTTVLFTIPPSFRASSVTPARALRYE